MWNMKLLTILLVFVAIVDCRDSSELEKENDNIFLERNNSSWYRLPENVLPESYELWILPQLAINNSTYEGKVEINVRVILPTDSLIVNVVGLKIDSQKSAVCELLNGTCTNEILIRNQELDERRQTYILSFGEKISPSRYFVSLSFTGEVLDDLNGFYRSVYESSKQKRWLGVTQFSSIFARRAFPCFDEPYMKATYRMHIGHYANETVTGNTKAEKIEQIKPGYFLTTFEKTPPMPTYLVGWAIHDFIHMSSNSTMFSLWTRESMRGKGSRFLEESVKIYDALEKWIGVKNPIRKMEQVAVPDFLWSAMENWGMITFRESAILWENGVTQTTKIHNGLITVAHEYAHTWFGNLVTPKFWNVAWLKEGFATFFGYYAIDLAFEGKKMMDLFGVEVLQPALLQDSFIHNRTMNGKDVAGPENIPSYMDFVTYKKGSSIIRMVYYLVGDKIYQRGLQSYVSTLANKFAIPNDFYDHLQRYLDQEKNESIRLREVVESWANQPGYPVVTVTRNYSTIDLTEIKQEPFLMNRTRRNVVYENPRWWIPINFAALDISKSIENITITKPREYENIWMRPEDERIIVPTVQTDRTILCNINQAYYYRVNYDLENWQRLTKYLKSNNFRQISSMNRASLIDDSFNLARAGYVEYSVPLELSRYLVQETEYEPWIAATTSFKFLNTMLSPLPHVKKAFQLYVNSLIEPIYRNLTFDENSSDQMRTKLLRSHMLPTACSMSNLDCLNTATILFEDWLENNKTITPDAKKTVYCIGLRSASSKNWRRVLGIFLNTELHSEQELLISGLGCTNKTALVREFLNYTLHNGPEIRKQYRQSIFDAVSDGSPRNVEYALDFVEDNLERIVATRDSAFLNKFLDSLNIIYDAQLEKLINFVERNEKLLGTSIQNAQKAIEFSKDNIAWIATNGPKIEAWII